MRILLIAYEFPPSPSPQSLRWAYLSRELAAAGHELHVLTADTGEDTPGLPELPDGVRMHRTFPGLIRGTLAAHRKYRERHPRRPAVSTSMDPDLRRDPVSAAMPPPPNWKLRVVGFVQAIAGYLHFPDMRGEWRHWGRSALHRLMDDIDPDVVISSHEPATTLELGLAVAGRKPWIVDLGDPVLAPYTPRRWQRRSLRIERAVCARATAITVTSEGTATLLRERHGRTHDVHVLTQGFDLAPAGPSQAGGMFDRNRLELLYTGSLYAFRRIDALLEAVASTPTVRLSIAAVTVPPSILSFARSNPGQIRLLGFLPHLAARALQGQADVLVNLANADPVQIPGKFYEYLGSCRPILHLVDQPDHVARQIRSLRRGWTCTQEADDIAGLLRQLAQAKAEQRLEEGLLLDVPNIAEHSWRQLGIRLDAIIREIAGRSPDVAKASPSVASR